MKVSLILTVLNEGDHIRRLLDSVVKQSRRPDEVVVCDGGSHDNTVAVIQEYADRLPLKILSAPGANISQGRNVAIRAATGDVIAVTDAGVWLEEQWLEELLIAGVWPINDGRQTMDGEQRSSVVNRPLSALVAGFYKSDPQNTFEVALGETTIPDAGEVNPEKFLPSSRSVAFRKEAWEAVGGYPEWLDFSEDVVFDLAMREKFGAFAFAPKAVAHFRPRGSLRSFARQYFNYAKGDGKANLWPKIHFIRYFTYLVAAPLGIYAAVTVSPWLWLLGVIAGLAYVRRPLQKLAGRRPFAAMLWVPVIRVAGDVAKMLGYPVGVWWRLTRQKDSSTD
ncbi:MAG TPA: glycosyltransferase [Anaerolineales bacterium]|nr:glycosyltransferase [Anaerolineales bacterium]